MPATRTRLSPALLGLGFALGLAAGGPAAPAGAAAGPHAHAGADATLELQLDDGRRWGTDAALREGMARIRDAMASALPRIHAGGLPSAEYDALAERVQAQVDYVAENCRLPEEADHQLHLVLAQILDGVGVMRDRGADRAEGAATVVRALDAYGRAFDHPGWTPLEH